MNFLILVGLLFGLATLGPPLLGFLIWVRSKFSPNPLSLEDGILRGYEIAWPNPKKI